MNERQALREQVYGVNSHLHVLHALEGLDAALAGASVPGTPHTIFQIVHHMLYWQDITVARLCSDEPERPASAAAGWSARAAPEDASEWDAAVACLAEGLRSIEQMLADPEFDPGRSADLKRGTSAREELLMLHGHNSYHLGQIVTLRQQLSTWPPPRGGDTW